MGIEGEDYADSMECHIEPCEWCGGYDCNCEHDGMGELYDETEE